MAINTALTDPSRVMVWQPILSATLIEGGAIQQIARIWTEQTAAGQSLSAWVCVTLAVAGWWNFYRLVTPQAVWARRIAATSIALNAAIVVSIIYWRYL